MKDAKQNKLCTFTSNVNTFLFPDTKGPRLYFNQPVPKKSGSGVRFSWRSSENAKFECALDNREVFFKCGEGFEAQLRFDNLKRNGEHVLHVRGTDDQNNVGDIISAEWTVGKSFLTEPKCVAGLSVRKRIGTIE